jgi:hypothetical protein
MFNRLVSMIKRAGLHTFKVLSTRWIAERTLPIDFAKIMIDLSV